MPSKADTEKSNQFDGSANGVLAAIQITDAEQAANDQSQQHQEPTDHHAVGVMMADVLKILMRFAILESLVFDVPTAFGHLE